MRLEMAQFLEEDRIVKGSGLELRAFNLTPGLVVLPSHGSAYGKCAWVVTTVRRDSDTEEVTVEFILHSATGDSEYYRTDSFDYNRLITVVGVCPNPYSVNDMDFGRD